MFTGSARCLGTLAVFASVAALPSPSRAQVYTRRIDAVVEDATRSRLPGVARALLQAAEADAAWPPSPTDLSATTLALGNRARSLDWLEEALRLRHPMMVVVRYHPWLAALHGEPRYEAVVRAMGFPETTT